MGARALIRAFAAAVLAAFVLAGFGAACSGPRATATDTGVRPSARSGFYRVETRVVNAGGAGQVEVTFRLRNKADGRIVTQSQSVELERHDRADVALEIAAPPGDYDVEARVEYPPR